MLDARRILLHSFVAVVVACSAASPTVHAVTIGLPNQVGSIAKTPLAEVSGIVAGRATANTFWMHNDSGDTARFYATNREGTLLGTFPLAGVTAVDWEDMAISRNASGGADLYFGDIGDNGSSRPFVTIYRTPEPLSTASKTIAQGQYASAKLQYPSGARNAESLIVDPLTNDVIIVSKGATTEIYSAPASAFSQALTTLSYRGTLGASLPTASAADISPDGRHILVRNRTAAFLFERAIGQSVADALHGPGMPVTTAVERQGEAIGWAADGASFFTTSETDGQPTAPIYQYLFSGPTPGDFDHIGGVNAIDLSIWRDHSGVDGWADANQDGVTNGDDFLAWQRNLAAASVVVQVPEPRQATSVAMIASALAAFGKLERRGLRRPRGTNAPQPRALA